MGRSGRQNAEARGSRRTLVLVGLVLMLLLVSLPALLFRRGDNFSGDSPQRKAIWLSKRVLAEAGGLAVMLWDPWRQGRVEATLAPEGRAGMELAEGAAGSAVELQALLERDPQWRGARVLSFANGRLPESRFAFGYQPWPEPRLDSLRGLYRLNEVASDSGGDFERFRLLMDWVHDSFGGRGAGSANPLPRVDYNFNSLDVLYRSRAQGERFWCSEYSTALVQCLAALGYTARYLMVGSDEAGHVLCEAWSDSLGQWVLLDPFWSRVVLLDDRPLAALEVHGLLRDQAALERAVVLSRRRPSTDESERAFYFGLFRNLAVRMRNDWFTNRYPHWYPLSNSVMNAVEWQDDLTRDNLYHKYETGRVEDLYWPLNQVRIMARSAGEGRLALRLDTATPNFSHFLLEGLEPEPRQAASPVLEWPLRHGINRLRVRSVNRLGISGRPAELVVEWNAPPVAGAPDSTGLEPERAAR